MSDGGKNRAYLWDNITLLSDLEHSDYFLALKSQLQRSSFNKDAFLRQTFDGIYLLTLGQEPGKSNPLEKKKILDRVQYSMLPNLNPEHEFFGANITQIKSHCFPLPEPKWYSLKKEYGNISLIVYFSKEKVKKAILDVLEPLGFLFQENSGGKVYVRKDRLVFSLDLMKLVSHCLWTNKSLSQVVKVESSYLLRKSQVCKELLKYLKNKDSDCAWKLKAGKAYYCYRGVTREFHYQTVAEDIIFTGYENKIADYISYCDLLELDLSPWHPSLTVRAFNYTAIRPTALVKELSGYVVSVVKEDGGRQLPINFNGQKKQFDLWEKRAQRYIPKNYFEARVIVARGAHKAVSLIGEMASSMAVFPSIIKGFLEEMRIDLGLKVKLSSSNQNMLIVSSYECPWGITHELEEKTRQVFELLDTDGSDYLEFYQECKLPSYGVGRFSLNLIPENFFYLLEKSKSLPSTMACGYNHYLKGLAYKCIREDYLAIDCFKRALQLDINDSEKLGALGRTLKEVGNFKEAAKFLSKAFRADSTDDELGCELGNVYLRLGYFEEAQDIYKRIYSLVPSSAEYAVNLGITYFRLEQYDAAYDVLCEALRLNPRYARAHEAMAMFYDVKGQEELAKRHALIAFDANPVSKSISELLWKLTVGKRG